MDACYAVLKKEANSLLASIPYIPRQTWEARLRNLFAKDEVGGPLAVMYLLQQCQKAAHGVVGATSSMQASGPKVSQD